MSIIPIPNTRVSNLLLRQRLTQQYQADQLDLFRLQEQISTGQRISLPSDDAPAALRAIALQRLIERKGQLETNIQGGLTYLAATDTAIADVATNLADLKGATLGVAGTIATQESRDNVISEINGFLESLLSVANRQFRGRYLFAGSQASQQPYSFDGDNVVYRGDDNSIQNYSDLGVRFASNATGQSVFGGISEAVAGSVDLNPQLSAETQLSSLRGGRGISPNGAITISDGNEASIVDLSGARTVGDVVRLIQENSPQGQSVEVAITGQGLTLRFASGNTLVVDEVGNGTTARELGIVDVTGTATEITGEDLDPILLKTTRLDNLLGSKARAVIESGASGDNADILIEASANGSALDGIAVQFIDGTPGVTAGNEVASFDGSTLTISIEPGESTANDVVAAINAQGTFTAKLDPSDSTSFIEAGTGAVNLSSTATTSGGLGESLDQASGIRVVNGGQTFDITFDGAETVEDLLNILNSSEAGLLAEVNAKGTGINIRSRLSGNDFQIGEINGGQTATQLGIRTYTEETNLSDFNYGVGVPTRDDVSVAITLADLKITASDEQEFSVDLSAETTLADAIIAINAVTTVNVTAQITEDGNGIELIDNTTGFERLTVAQSGSDIPINGGIGFSLPSDDFAITAIDGQNFRIDVGNAKTVGDVIDTINTATGGAITARLAESGNGIELVDNTAGPGELTVTAVSGSQAAEYLGFLAENQPANSSTTGTLTGTDQNFLETDSVFNTLIRLRDALQDNDINAIERALAKVDSDINRVTFSRAEVGARVRGLEFSRDSLQDEEIQLRSALSDQIDVDLVEAISELTARQISLEASLRSSANILQLSLLNFI